VPQDYWDAVRIDGKIQTIPSTWKEYVTGGIAYREDLRAKYELPIPDSIEKLETYMEGIKQNEPLITPIGNTESKHMGPYMDLKYEPAGTTEHGVPYGLIIPYDAPSNVIQYYGSNDHLEDLKRMKSWMDKGYWSRNILSMKDSAPGLLQNGRTAMIIGENPTRFNDSVLRIATTQPEWELGYFPFPNAKGYATSVHPIHNGFAIPKSSSHPERALAFYEKMVLDKRYNWLTSYGIEGTHFEVVDGFYKMIGTSEMNGFLREGMNSWAWRNPEFMLFDSSFQKVQELFNEFDKIARPDYFTGFAEDWTSYQAERAALEQVSAQYLWPLNVGLIDDVEKGLEIFMDKAKQAGLEKIQEEYTRQWFHFIEEKGIVEK
jgi:putative aldouronate transport system substrate-binding protein